MGKDLQDLPPETLKELKSHFIDQKISPSHSQAETNQYLNNIFQGISEGDVHTQKNQHKTKNNCKIS